MPKDEDSLVLILAQSFI